jgi:3-oxoacyl-(acyl-carrier-protein) synthase
MACPHPQARGANILAEYLGGAITCDAYHMTDPRADGLGVSTCIELALKDAGIEKEQVGFLFRHCKCRKRSNSERASVQNQEQDCF